MTALLWTAYVIGAPIALYVVMALFEGVDPRWWRW